jgi:hypothetical protein
MSYVDEGPWEGSVDIGHDHWLKYSCWKPNRALNPQYDGVPDVEKFAVMVWHKTTDGRWCVSGCNLAGDVQRKIEPNHPAWQVDCWEPLTLSPSILCLTCRDHGFIREGKWVTA